MLPISLPAKNMDLRTRTGQGLRTFREPAGKTGRCCGETPWMTESKGTTVKPTVTQHVTNYKYLVCIDLYCTSLIDCRKSGKIMSRGKIKLSNKRIGWNKFISSRRHKADDPISDPELVWTLHPGLFSALGFHLVLTVRGWFMFQLLCP